MPNSNLTAHVAHLIGQVHSVKALAHAVINTHSDRETLLREFQSTSNIGHDQIRSLPTPQGAIRAYKQTCDEFLVAMAKASHERERIVPL